MHSFDDPNAPEREDAWDKLDPSFPTGEDPALDTAADGLLVEDNPLRSCDFCRTRDREQRFTVKDAYAKTYFLVCASCFDNQGKAESPSLTKQAARAETDQDRTFFERLMAQDEFIVRLVKVKGAFRPAQTDPQFAIAEANAREARRKTEARRRDQEEVVRLRMGRDFKLAKTAEAKSFLVREILERRAAYLSRPLDELLVSRGDGRRIIDLSLLQFVAHGCPVDAIEIATGYKPHQVRDSLSRARLELAA